jgi:hypothetical protein
MTAKPKALQSRAEVEAERRPEMPAARGPDREHACAGMPGCRESAHRWMRAGQSRRRERCVAVVVIVVAVVIVVIVSLSCHSRSRSCGHGCGHGYIVALHGSGSGGGGRVVAAIFPSLPF